MKNTNLKESVNCHSTVRIFFSLRKKSVAMGEKVEKNSKVIVDIKEERWSHFRKGNSMHVVDSIFKIR